MPRIDRRAVLTLFGCGAFAGAYYGTEAVLRRRRALRYRPAKAVENGLVLTLVFFANSKCGACNTQGLPTVLERAKLSVQESARGRGYGFQALAVAVDPLPGSGIRFLDRFGAFDEIASGGGWLNLGCRKYLEELPGLAATPQIAVVSQQVVTDSSGTTVRDEHALLRKAGHLAISDWVRIGCPLPAIGRPAMVG